MGRMMMEGRWAGEDKTSAVVGGLSRDSRAIPRLRPWSPRRCRYPNIQHYIAQSAPFGPSGHHILLIRQLSARLCRSTSNGDVEHLQCPGRKAYPNSPADEGSTTGACVKPQAQSWSLLASGTDGPVHTLEREGVGDGRLDEITLCYGDETDGFPHARTASKPAALG